MSRLRENPLRAYRRALNRCGERRASRSDWCELWSVCNVCIRTSTDSAWFINRLLWFWQHTCQAGITSDRRRHAHAVLFPYMCSDRGGSWVFFCKSSHRVNKTSRRQLILPPQHSVLSHTADSLTSIYSTYLSQLQFTIGVYIQGLPVSRPNKN